MKCPRCNRELPDTKFYKNTRTKSGFSYWCVDCENKRIPVKYESKKDANRDREMRKLFGITLHKYNNLLERQKGLCSICGLPQISKNLAVDHNHNTGEIRGLLCEKCNQALGLFNADNFGALNLLKAIEYLKK